MGVGVPPEPMDLQPGQSYVMSTVDWDQAAETERGTCSGGAQVPPDSYTSRATVGRVPSDTSTFTITS
jgi:hypothetical protein